jgi:CubicO group peptidase (beta-lactamase class C family)
MIVRLVLVVIASASFAEAQTPPVRPDRAPMTAADVQQAVPAFVREQIARRKIAGAVIVLVKDGAVLVEDGYGLADVAARRPMQSQTPVRIGSITKLLTALAVMQLAGEERLSLDEPVGMYLDFAVPVAPGSPAVTLRRLLSHQTAFEDRIGGIASASGPHRPFAEFIAARRTPQLSLPDDAVAYANYNASLAARVVECVSGESFEQYLAGHIFTTLGMTRTTAVQPAPDAWQVSSGYVTSDAAPTRLSMAADPILEVGSTGVVTSASDIARLLRALLETNPLVVSRQALDQMTTSQTPVPLGVMGLGMYSPLGAGGNPFIGHDGGTGSFQSVLGLLPGEDFGIFAAYNSDGLSQPVSATAELLQFVARRYFGDEQPSVRSTEVIAGTYAPTHGVVSNLFRLRQLIQQVTVTWSNDRPMAGAAFLPTRQPLDAQAPGAFRWSGRDVAFTSDGDEALMQIGAPPGMYYRVPWWQSAGVVVPVVAACLMISLAIAILQLVRRLRWMRTRLSGPGRPVMVRVALLLHAGAWSAGLWLVFAEWRSVAWASGWVTPLALAIYAAAWTGVLLTPLAVRRLVSFARVTHSPLRLAGEAVLVLMLVLFSFFSVYWRIAGTTLDL